MAAGGVASWPRACEHSQRSRARSSGQLDRGGVHGRVPASLSRHPPAGAALPTAGVALVCALALGVAPASQAATNLVPNAGFEVNCSGVPCNWQNGFGTTIVRDTTHAVASQASGKVTLTGQIDQAGAPSDCVNTPIAAGTHEGSLWYLTSDASVGHVGLVVVQYSQPACNASSRKTPDPFAGTVAVRDGNWHAFQFTITIPAGVASVQFSLAVESQQSGQTPSVNFDSVDFEQETLAVALASFDAARSRHGVLVRWRTATEADELGFNVFREQHGRRVRVNRRLLPAFGGMTGRAYVFRDRAAPRYGRVRYWLQDVDARGQRTWHGPAVVAAS